MFKLLFDLIFKLKLFASPLHVFETSTVYQYDETPSQNSSKSPSFPPHYDTHVSKSRALVSQIYYTSYLSVFSTTSSQSLSSHLRDVSSPLKASLLEVQLSPTSILISLSVLRSYFAGIVGIAWLVGLSDSDFLSSPFCLIVRSTVCDLEFYIYIIHYLLNQFFNIINVMSTHYNVKSKI